MVRSILLGLVLAGAIGAAEAQRRAINICKPPAGGARRAPGTIHDDQVGKRINCTLSSTNCGTTQNAGYGDNLNCGVIIQAPAGQTVSAIFTDINLESPGQHKGCGKCPATGCDYVKIYDGPTAASRLIGTYSGTKIPAGIHSTTNQLFVQFHTDDYNCGITGGTDPGFYLDYHFEQHASQQSSICNKNSVFTTATGTISDDQPNGGVKCTGASCGTAGKGYGDNLDCGVRIKAPTGDTVNLRFTQMNLESGRPNKACGQCPPPGCDTVSVFDGPTNHSKLIGKYSGTKPPAHPIKGTASSMFVEFKTDAGNCQISGKSDPGFFAKWSFQAHGLNICRAPSIVRAGEGIIHDDKPTSNVDCSKKGANCGSSASVGYSDNLDCGVDLRAPHGKVVQLQMFNVNLEAAGCSTPNPCPQEGCDYLAVYDGTNNASRLLNTFTGVITQAGYKTVLSTGSNMFVRFKTDFHNCGIKGSSDPGFFAKWKFVDPPLKLAPGQKQRTVFVGHSTAKSKVVNVNGVQRCSATPVNAQDPAWNSVFAVKVTAPNQITVRRKDHTQSKSGWTQRLIIRCAVGSAAPPPPSRPLVTKASCVSQLYTLEKSLNNICCANGCPSNGMIATCSQQCAAVWMPFSKTCSEYLRLDPQLNSLLNISKACEQTEFGKWNTGGSYFGGRCSTLAYNRYTDKVSTACCGANNEHCGASSATTPKMMTSGTCSAGFRVVRGIAACNAAAHTIGLADVTATQVNLAQNPRGCYYKGTTKQLYMNTNGNIHDNDTDRKAICVPRGASTGVGLTATNTNLPSTCTTRCAVAFDDYYAECAPRFKSQGNLFQYRAFLQKCQGVETTGR